MEKGKAVWLYDILLDDFIVGTQGDLAFDSKRLKKMQKHLS